MRRMKTKVSAMLVALCMLVSLLPAVPVVTAEAADGDFTLILDTALNTATITANGYEVNRSGTTKAVYTNLVTNGNGVFSGTTMNLPFSATGNTLSLDFKVINEGYYDIVGTIYDSGYSGTFATYINGALIGQHLYDSVDGYDNAMHELKEYEFSGTYLKAGNNTITFKWISGRDRFYPQSFVFTKNTEPTAETETVSFNWSNYVNKYVYNETDAAYENVSYATASIGLNGWETVANTFAGAQTYFDTAQSFAKFEGTADNQYFTFKFIVDAAAWYNVDVALLRYTEEHGGIGFIYIDGKKIGRDSWIGASETVRYDSLYLDAGEHTFTIKGVAPGVTRRYYGIKSVTLTPATKVPEKRFIEFNLLGGLTSVADATLDNAGWKINTDLTTKTDDNRAIPELTASYIVNNNKWTASDVLAIDFVVPASGTYDMSAAMFDYGNDAGMNLDVYVGKDGAFKYAGRIYNDMDTDVSSQAVTKGFKNVTLEEGTNTIKFVALSRDEIPYMNYPSNSYTGRFYFALSSLTLTPANGGEADEVVITAADTVEVGKSIPVTAKVVDASGNEVTATSITITSHGSGWANYVAPASYSNGYVTGDKVGTAIIVATATVNGEQYKARKVVTVTEAEPEVVIPESAIFGNTYAYVKDGTVYFIGGLKTIENYTEVGFEVLVNGTQVDDIKTSEVYKSFTVGTKSVSAENWDSSYIFITEKTDLKTGDKVVIKPYIANGTAKTYHATDFTLELTV